MRVLLMETKRRVAFAVTEVELEVPTLMREEPALNAKMSVRLARPSV